MIPRRCPPVLIGMLCLIPWLGYANTFTVTVTADSGAGSLSQAVADANANAGDDTIVFDGTLNDVTIGLSSGHLVINDTTGGKTTIDASALGDGVILSPGQASRIFFISGGNTVEMRNLTLRDGKTANSGVSFTDPGGAISNQGDLTLRDCHLLDNRTGDSTGSGLRSGAGGAIYSGLNSSVTAIDCVFTNNQTGNSDSTSTSSTVKTGSGGVVYSLGPATLTRCTFTGNQTGNTTQVRESGSGGALYVARAALVIDDCTFENNLTGAAVDESGAGGALIVGGDGSSLTVRDSSFLTNATGIADTTGRGGAITHSTGPLVIERSDFAMNQTGSLSLNMAGNVGVGGAISVYNTDFAGSISDSTFTGNHTGNGIAGGNGGAIGAQTAATTMERCGFAGNYTGDGALGPGLVVGPGGNGGAIYQIGAGLMTVVDCDFDGNFTGDAADTGIAPGIAGGGGGAIYNANQLVVRRSTFRNNSTGIGTNAAAPGGPGGAIFSVGGVASSVLANSTFIGNHTATNSLGGGAVAWKDGATGAVRNCTVTGNSAPGSFGEGGGLWCNVATKVKVDNSIIAENIATTGPDVYEGVPGAYYSDSASPKNLIGKNPGAAASFTAGGLIGTSGSPVVPDLDGLADNGGHTLTRAPIPGGNAVDAGDSTVAPLPIDQRDSVRVFGSAVDLGSVEHAVPPEVPTGLTATGRETGILLSWTGGANTDSYRIYRHGSIDFSMATDIGTTASTTFEDSSTAPNVGYYYWIVAVNAAFDSVPSAHAFGHRLTPSLVHGLTATNQGDGIALSWNPGAHARTYDLYQSASDDSGTASKVMSTSGTTYLDSSTAVGAVTYYWVKAVIDGYESPFSLGAMGKRLHPAVGNPQASVDFFDDRIRLSWNQVAGAVNEYVIYRNLSADMTGATEVGREVAGSFRFDDLTPTPDVSYFYLIQPVMADGHEAATSPWFSGKRSAVTTHRPDVLIGKSAAAKQGDGIYNTNGGGQTVKVRSKRRKSLKIYLRIEVDGSQQDALFARGTRGNRKFKAIYFGPTGNITGAMIRGSQALSLASGAGAELKLVTKRKGRKTGRLARKSFRVTGTSQTVSDRSDTGLGKVWSG